MECIARRAGCWLLVCAAVGIASGSAADSGPDGGLVPLRAIAQAYRKAGPGKDTAVALEYRINRASNACENGAEQSLRLLGDGRLSLLRFRSPAESELAGPAGFSGRLTAPEWDSLFAVLSRMRWETGGALMPMPGMSEANREIKLQRGKQAAAFDVTGHLPPAQAAVEAGLDAVSDLARRAIADTQWSLALAGVKAARQGGILRVKASWKLKGRRSLRLRLPLAGEASGACGSASLRWTLIGPETPGVTPLPPTLQDAEASKPPRAGAWVDLRPGDSASVTLAFAVPASAESDRKKAKGSRLQAQLVHSGASVLVGGTADTLAVTLHSPWFPF